MSAAIDTLSPQKRVAIVASNPTVSKQTGWPIGFWWSELTHPYWEFVEHGYAVDIYSPDGGALQPDSWSDPRDESQYSTHDLISLGFLSSPEHCKLVESTKPISQLEVADYDAILFVGGQAPMYTSTTTRGSTPLQRTAMRRERSRPSCAMPRAFCSRPLWMENSWLRERPGLALPTPKKDSQTNSLASVSSHFGSKTRQGSWRTAISSYRVGSRLMRCAMEILLQGSNSIPAPQSLGL